MRVRTVRLRRALHGIDGTDADHMLINMIFMHVMEMAVVKVIDMAVVADGRVPTVGTMLVGMVGMMLFVAGGHSVFPSLSAGRANRRLLPFGSVLDGAFD
jgi:hypothetical protein